MKMLKEMKTIEKIDDQTKIMYWRFKMPMMSDRDNVVKQVRMPLSDTEDYVLLETIERDDVPEVPGAVRMFTFIRGYVRDSKEIPGAIDYTEITLFNMRGYFPSRLLNMVISSELNRDMGNMYKHLAAKN